MVRQSLQTDRSRSMGLLDDRGVPLRLAPDGVMRGQLWDRSPFRLWLGPGLIILFVGIQVFMAIRDRRVPQLNDMIVGLVVFSGVAAVFIVGRVLRRRPPQSSLAAYLAAHRICGACGYDLHTIAPESDGCVICPECGGAWHGDRFVFADRDPRSTPRLAALVAAGHKLATSNTCDDRGVPMAHPWRWYPHWMRNSTSTSTRAIDTAADQVQRRFHRRAIPPAAFAWGLGLVLLLRINDNPDLIELLIIGAVSVLIVTLVYYVAFRLLIDRAMYRCLSRMGVCINCGTQLPDDQPSSFDSCVNCPSCKLAWHRTS